MAILCVVGLWRHRRHNEAIAEVVSCLTGGFDVRFAPDDVQHCRSADSVAGLMRRENFMAPGVVREADIEGVLLAPAEVLQVTHAPVRTIQDMMQQLELA